jgi:hypothetical protein
MPTTNDDDSGYETDATVLDEDYDAGYATDATVPAEEYDSEEERAFNAKNKKQKMSTPSTPEPMIQGPEPSTEILKKTGSPLHTRIEGYEGMVPYTRNSYKIGQIPLDKDGKQVKPEELPESIQRDLFEVEVEVKGGVAKSRRRRRAKKSSRKRHSRHTRKSAHKRRARSRRSKH